MSKITKFAEGKDCTARIPGVCNGNPKTSVWAHLNSTRWGAGRGIKAKDVCGLIACYDCHLVIDGAPSKYHKIEVQLMAYEGHMESLVMLVENGLAEVK